MGRAKYTAEKRNEIITAFVKATIEILKTGGVDDVSIRNVSERAGYSSATLYLYFEDLNELISIASISYLSNYVRDIAETSDPDHSAAEVYYYTWEVFADHALNKPCIYHNLFFGPSSDNLDRMVKSYYELFPDELETVKKPFLSMLEAGKLSDRNMAVLQPYAAELGLTKEETRIANEITVAYFQSLIYQAAQDEITPRHKLEYFDKFLQGAAFILRGELPQ